MNNIIEVQSQKKLSDENLNKILNSINVRSEIKFTSIECKVDDSIYGGIIIKFGDKTIVINDVTSFAEKNLNSIIIQSKSVLEADVITKVMKIARKKFNISEDISFLNEINKDIISGIRIRYKDEEIDMTMNRIIDQIFTNI